MRTSSLVKVDILLNATIVDALSSLMHTDNAYSIGKKCVRSWRNWFQDNNLTFPVQAAIGVKVISWNY
jgi:GTP-binding protein LepA